MIKNMFQPIHALYTLAETLPAGNSEISPDSIYYINLADVADGISEHSPKIATPQIFLPIAGLICVEKPTSDDYGFVLLEIGEGLTKKIFTKMDLMLYQKIDTQH
jgi:hypothetical protein